MKIMRKLIIIITLNVSLITLQVTAIESVKNVSGGFYLNNTDSTTTATIQIKEKNINKENVQKPSTVKPALKTESVNFMSSTSNPPMFMPSSEAISATPITFAASSLTTLLNSAPTKTIPTPTEDPLSPPASSSLSSSSLNQYCFPSLCEFYNGSHTTVRPHIACKNSSNFGEACGLQPHLLNMSARRRNLILDLHNLARSRIASGQVNGYKSASHMPQLKWDNELEYLASLHVIRCKFQHDLCHNTPRFPYSGQNIGYFWKGANITSHSKRIKNLIVKWYQERKNANQSFIDSFHLHPDDKKAIGHFTLMVSDRVHHIGCGVIRFYESNLTQILMTCNYDYNNFPDESIYQTGPTASRCTYKRSSKYPGLCEWKLPAYEYELENK